MHKRIMITGASGVGKTTLASHISEQYDLPFVTSSAKAIWPRFGFKNHQEAHEKSVKDKMVGVMYQAAILNQRLMVLDRESYITDSSPIDNMAYIMMQLGYCLDHSETLEFITSCNTGMVKCNGLIFIRWNGDIKLEDDGKRMMNPFYQAYSDAVIDWIIKDMIVFRICPILELTQWNFLSRITEVDKWIKKL